MEGGTETDVERLHSHSAKGSLSGASEGNRTLILWVGSLYALPLDHTRIVRYLVKIRYAAIRKPTHECQGSAIDERLADGHR